MQSNDTTHLALCSLLSQCRVMSTKRSTVSGRLQLAEVSQYTMLNGTSILIRPSEGTSRVLLCAGSTSFSVKKGSNLKVAFQARPGVVITGGSSNLGFMDDPGSWHHTGMQLKVQSGSLITQSPLNTALIVSVWIKFLQICKLCIKSGDAV